MKHKSAPTVVGVWITLLATSSFSSSMFAQSPAFTPTAPTPYIDVISPTAARVSGSGFILILDGAGFVPGAEVNFQRGGTTAHLPAVVVSASELATYVPSHLLAKAATATITVVNHQGRGLVGTSNPVPLPITVPTSTITFNQTNITLPSDPMAIVTADFNGDGKADLAVSEPCGDDPTCASGNGALAILLGNGDGSFTAAASPVVNQYPGALAVGDFNGDGNTDIAVANLAGSTVSILLGNGHGGFIPAPFPAVVGTNPTSIAVGDLNGDGKLDLVVASYGVVYVLLGNGVGSFTPAASPSAGSQPGSVVVGDLNRDGKLDLIVGSNSAPYTYILLGRGNGTFAAAPTPPSPTAPGAVGDVNGDGNLDLVFALGNSPGFAQTTVSVDLGYGNGLFRTGPTSPVVNEGFNGGILADLNGDGKLDLASAVGYPSNSYAFLLGNGKGVFNLSNSIVVSNNGNGPGVVADFNADGRLDLATINDENGGTVSILLQTP